MREAREIRDDATVIEFSERTAGRLAIAGQDLHAGEPIEVQVADLGMVPARVEFDSRMGWVGYLREARESNEASVLAFLHPGLKARRP